MFVCMFFFVLLGFGFFIWAVVDQWPGSAFWKVPPWSSSLMCPYHVLDTVVSTRLDSEFSFIFIWKKRVILSD